MKKKICLERIVSYIFLQGIKILFFSALFREKLKYAFIVPISNWLFENRAFIFQ